MSYCRISAIGMVNALGSGVSAILPRLLAGDRSGVHPISGFLSEGTARLGAALIPRPNVPKELFHLGSRNTQLLVASFAQIVGEVTEAIARYGAGRVAVVIGSSTSGIPQGEYAIAAREQGLELPDDYLYSQQEMGAPAEVVSILSGALGPAYCISTACSSSAKVFRAGREFIASGVCDAVIVGGADCLCCMTVQGFGSLELLSNEPTNPFSKNRSGINIGEGATLLLLTKDPGGVQILGVGEASDAYHISSPHPEGKGAITAMQLALRNAGVSPSDVSYLNLHGTGTLHNDAMEARAVAAVFGDHVASLACSSTKPLVGHMLGASGASEVAFCAMALEQRNASGELPLPPHIFDGEYDSELPRLRLVDWGETLRVSGTCIMMSNSFGFGGSNCSVVLGAQAF